MTKLIPQPGIMDIALYQGGASSIVGRTDVLKLSSNENPRGPVPAAIDAFAASAANAHRYPSTDHAALRRAIGEVYDLPEEQIICGVGSDEVLQFACHAFAGEGDEIIHTEHGFSMYPILAKMVGATPVCVAEKNRVVDVDAILAAVTKATRIVFLTNPGNPTGTRISDHELARIVEALPERVLLILDGAYTEYSDGYDGGASFVSGRHNILMTRTFSKIYGLGGLRVGWGYASRTIIDVLNRVRQPFNLAGPQLAAAEAAVRDQRWVEDCAAENAVQRRRLIDTLHELGIAADESETNFVLARFADAAEADSADCALRDAGILVRKVAGYGFPEGLRITVADKDGTTRIIKALTAWRKELK